MKAIHVRRGELNNRGEHGNTALCDRQAVMPDHSELTVELARMAFELIGSDTFSVGAALSVERPESLRNFGLLESILLMAYNEGKAAGKRS